MLAVAGCDNPVIHTKEMVIVETSPQESRKVVQKDVETCRTIFIPAILQIGTIEKTAFLVDVTLQEEQDLLPIRGIHVPCKVEQEIICTTIESIENHL